MWVSAQLPNNIRPRHSPKLVLISLLLKFLRHLILPKLITPTNPLLSVFAMWSARLSTPFVTTFPLLLGFKKCRTHCLMLTTDDSEPSSVMAFMSTVIPGIFKSNDSKV